MFKSTRVLGTPFEDALEHGAIQIKSDEMYVCTVENHINIAEPTVDRAREVALSQNHLKNYHTVFSIHEDEVLLSDRKKYYITIQYSFYSLILDTLISILYIKKHDPEAVFIINAPSFAVSYYQEHEKAMVFLHQVFMNNSIEFYFIPGCRLYNKDIIYNQNSSLVVEDLPGTSRHVLEVPIYKVKNCTVVKNEMSRLMTYADLVDSFDRYVAASNPNQKVASQKNLKVYISRGGSKDKGVSFIEPGDPRSGYVVPNARIYEEHLIEEYLKSIGFVVLNPDENLSIVDQILFMKSASVLVGVTGSGFVNSLFMEKGKTVIELLTELRFEGNDTATVPEYWHLCQAKDHTYIGLDLIDRQGATAVEKLKALFEKVDLNKLS